MGTWKGQKSDWSGTGEGSFMENPVSPPPGTPEEPKRKRIVREYGSTGTTVREYNE